MQTIKTHAYQTRAGIRIHRASIDVEYADASTELIRSLDHQPGVLLSSSSEYKLTELPADKASKLVFYCANASCKASDAAARRAQDAGYTVAVLQEGIMGWKKAGQATAKP